MGFPGINRIKMNSNVSLRVLIDRVVKEKMGG